MIKTFQFLGLLLFLYSCNAEEGQTSISTPAANSDERNQGIVQPISQEAKLATTASEGSPGSGLPPEAKISCLVNFESGVVAGTDANGLFLYDPVSEQWKQIGSELPNKKINALHAAEGKVYAGVYRAGLFVSEDKGISWISLNADIPDLRVQSILTTDFGLLAGTDTGLFRWNRGQETWESLYTGVQINDLYAFDKQLSAATHKGMLFSRDGGKNWRWALEKGAVMEIEYHQWELFISTISGEQFRSFDRGLSWIKRLDQEQGSSNYLSEILKNSSKNAEEANKNASFNRWRKGLNLPQRVIFGITPLEQWFNRPGPQKNGEGC